MKTITMKDEAFKNINKMKLYPMKRYRVQQVTNFV